MWFSPPGFNGKTTSFFVVFVSVALLHSFRMFVFLIPGNWTLEVQETTIKIIAFPQFGMMKIPEPETIVNSRLGEVPYSFKWPTWTSWKLDEREKSWIPCLDARFVFVLLLTFPAVNKNPMNNKRWAQ